MTRQLLVFVIAAACATSPRFPAARFANAPPAHVVDDRFDVPEPPKALPYFMYLSTFDGIIQRRLTRGLELPRARRALGVNAIDEVPDSTWFTNRIGVRDISVDELRAGPARIDSPTLHKPWTVTSTKEGGTEVGFIIKDARGIKFLLKFDQTGFPEQDTAAHVITNRFLWACGYNTPEDFVVTFKRTDLVLAPNAVQKDDLGHEHKLDRHHLDLLIAQVDNDHDGVVRGMASRWLAGKMLGGHPSEGTRRDDPNDRIPHELRRDLRGLYVIVAWLDSEDIQQSNFIDAWVTDPIDSKRHYVKHYMIDFGKSLGVFARLNNDPRAGFEYGLDFAAIARSLVTGGVLVRSWERRRATVPIPGVGLFDAASFDPGAWRSLTPAYVPFLKTDRFDSFWAAKIVMRWTRAQIRAVVELGELTDPRAVDYLTDVLVARQRKTGAYSFSRVNPLDQFAITDDALCFDDLWLVHELGPSVDTRYTITLYDRRERALGAFSATPGDNGHVCTAPLALAPDGDGYTIAKVTTLRPSFVGTTYVHVARDPATRKPRVIGVWRE